MEPAAGGGGRAVPGRTASGGVTVEAVAGLDVRRENVTGRETVKGDSVAWWYGGAQYGST